MFVFRNKEVETQTEKAVEEILVVLAENQEWAYQTINCQIIPKFYVSR